MKKKRFCDINPNFNMSVLIWMDKLVKYPNSNVPPSRKFVIFSWFWWIEIFGFRSHRASQCCLAKPGIAGKGRSGSGNNWFVGQEVPKAQDGTSIHNRPGKDFLNCFVVKNLTFHSGCLKHCGQFQLTAQGLYSQHFIFLVTYSCSE